MTPEERTAKSLGGRIGANRRWAKVTDRAAELAPARAGFQSRFERQVDPEGALPIPERARLAENARRAYFAELALKSARARARRKAQGSEAA